MSYEESLKSITLNADASLAVYTGVSGVPGSPQPNFGKQYTFVKVTGIHQAGLATAAADGVVGVLQSKPQQTGQEATVAIFGVSNVMTGGVFVAGDWLAPDATGRAVKSAGASGFAIALAPSTGADTLVPALLKL
jgi:hypothetical protein